MSSRRSFLRQSALAAGALSLPSAFLQAAEWARPRRLTLLHTNDVHSRIDPFPMDGGRNAGQGGVAARAALISRIRQAEDNVLLLDAGDIFQGTPYFNLYKGEPELRAMTAMSYDAGTIGNHDFDAGIENLAAQLRQHARFPMIICNYDFTGTPMETVYQPWRIVEKGGLKIGLLGVGIELKGLVPENLSGKTVYLDPIVRANETAALLHSKGCDLVICLSHLGYRYRDNTVSDLILAAESAHIDCIIGGHTHTFLDKPTLVRNKRGAEVVVNQVGFAGLRLGRLDYVFEAKKRGRLVTSEALAVSKISEE